VNGILVGTGTIAELGPGDLKMSVCDLQLMETSEVATFIVEIDGTNSVDETLEGNNLLEIVLQVEIPDDGARKEGGSATIAIISLMAVLISLAAFQLGPNSLKKEFRRRK
jgi:hypothetical protein